MENSLQNPEITEIQENTFWSWATFFSWRGRISRKEYWTILFVSQGFYYVTIMVLYLFFLLFVMDIGAVVSCGDNAKCIEESINSGMGYTMFLWIYVLWMMFTSIWMFFVVTIKRFHDVNMRGWWVLLPIANFIIPAFIRWTEWENRFGKPTKTIL